MKSQSHKDQATWQVYLIMVEISSWASSLVCLPCWASFGSYPFTVWAEVKLDKRRIQT